MKFYEITQDDCDCINNKIKALSEINHTNYKRNIWAFYFMSIAEIDIHEINNNDKDCIDYQLNEIVKIAIKLILVSSGIKPIKIKMSDTKKIYTLLDNSIRCFVNNREYLNSSYYLLSIIIHLGFSPIGCLKEKLDEYFSMKGENTDRGYFKKFKGAYDKDDLLEKLEQDYIMHDNIIDCKDYYSINFKNHEIAKYYKWHKADYYKHLLK